MSKCRECEESEATEGNGMCFSCTEELAVLLHDSVIELGYDEKHAAAAAQSAWKGE